MVNTNTNIPDPTLTLPGCPPDNHNKDINLRNFRCFPKSKKFEEFFYKRIARYLGGTYETITNTAITNNASSSVSNSIDSDSDSDLSLSLEESVGIDYDHSSIWLNQNVALMLVISLGYGAVKSIWEGTVTGAYFQQTSENVNIDIDPVDDDIDNIDVLSSDDDGEYNAYIPYIVSSDGILGLLAAIPVGRYLDRHHGERAAIIRLGAYVVLYGCVAVLIALFLINVTDNGEDSRKNIADEDLNDSVFWIYVGIEIIWLIFREIMEAPALILCIASIPADERRITGLTLLFSAEVALSFIGPVISAILYSKQGKEWSNETMKYLMIVVLFSIMVLTFGLFYFDDDKAIYRDILPSTLTTTLNLDNDDTTTGTPAQSEARADPGCHAGEAALASDINEPLISESSNKTLTSAFQNSNESEHNEVNNESGFIERASMIGERISSLVGLHRIATNLLFAIGLQGFGAGLAYDYERQFTTDHANLSDSQAELIFVAIPFLTIASFYVAKYFSRDFGRPKVIVACKSIGTVFALCNSFALYMDDDDFFLTGITIVQLLLRMTLPLEFSLLVDVVDGLQLGYFLALFGVFEYSWNAANFVGKEINDNVSDQFLFFVTALFYSAALLFYCSLLSVPS